MKKPSLFKRILSALRPPKFPPDDPQIPGMAAVPNGGSVADSLRGVSPDTEFDPKQKMHVITTPNAILAFPVTTPREEIQEAVRSTMQDLAGYYFWAANTGRVVDNIDGSPGISFHVPPHPKGSTLKQ